MKDLSLINQDSTSSNDIIFYLLSSLLISYVGTRIAKTKNNLRYEDGIAKIISSLIILFANLMHTSCDDIEIPSENALLAIGPHRLGWEAAVVAGKLNGPPPRFLATDAYDAIPFLSSFMKKFQVIFVQANAKKSADGHSANHNALDEAGKTLRQRGCVALFPQGNLSKIGQEPPRVYSGIAKLAIQNHVGIHVIRLDGFWCLENPLIPVFIKNLHFYRLFLSLFHLNNIRTTLCTVIDFHLKPENQHLSEEEKIDEICAQLYAYYRQTGDLNVRQIDDIKIKISDNRHHLLWKNKLAQDGLRKQLVTLKQAESDLDSTKMSVF